MTGIAADWYMIENVKFIGDFPIDCRGSAVPLRGHLIANPTPIRGEIRPGRFARFYRCEAPKWFHDVQNTKISLPAAGNVVISIIYLLVLRKITAR